MQLTFPAPAGSCLVTWTRLLGFIFGKFGRNLDISTTALLSAVSTTIFKPTQHPEYRESANASNPIGIISETFLGKNMEFQVNENSDQIDTLM